MVEFKLDRRDGRPRLMEINGRFWNSLPLAVAAGVDFPWMLYRLATEGDVPECVDYRVGVQARWLVGDCRHLVEVMRGRPAGWTDDFPERGRTARDFLRFFGRTLHYDVESLTDPLPAVADVADVVLQSLAKARARQRRRAAREIQHV
jgi:predicted ATP-grasp superfamily ATP-dependent carboligase